MNRSDVANTAVGRGEHGGRRLRRRQERLHGLLPCLGRVLGHQTHQIVLRRLPRPKQRVAIAREPEPLDLVKQVHADEPNPPMPMIQEVLHGKARPAQVVDPDPVDPGHGQGAFDHHHRDVAVDQLLDRRLRHADV